MEAQSSRQIISTFKLMRPADDYHEQLYLTLIPLKVVLATQCVFLAHACQQLQDAGIARIKKQFAYTWEKRISAYYQSPVAIAADAGADALAEQRQFKVGIVGAGFMGGQVARTMLDAGFEPTQLLLATRTPSRQKELAARGVHLVTDLESVASRAHVLFLCVLPAHLQDVSRGLRKSVSRQTLVVSLVAGVTRVKLEQMLDSPAAFVLNSEETLTALRASRIGLPGQGGAPPAAPMKQLTPHLLRLSAASLAPELSGLVDLVRAMPVVLTGLELPEGDSRTACLVRTASQPPALLSDAACPALPCRCVGRSLRAHALDDCARAVRRRRPCSTTSRTRTWPLPLSCLGR
eukprot:7229313-Prymnesium_polylepis.1